MASGGQRVLAINNLLANYCIGLDTKDLDLLRSVFTSDAELDYSGVTAFKAVLTGADDIINKVAPTIKDRHTQHALSTQRLTFEDDGDVCLALTYFTMNGFIPDDGGGWTHTTVYGYYDDKLDQLSPGEWRISKRTIHTFHPRVTNASATTTP
ncbi:hypothetical protein EJ06DRAFT_556457 [Trichodelitschia bisporula]|uniref:SnoaL-like domain-containing protein n=1 Tax=Trichodelitschia bisporula TaxID=703511 RepID=A0A6G1HY71_9PEZI|nr:hypothetical protein EJ06DRAFT_556457 [Trichodelitschia bisporula]